MAGMGRVCSCRADDPLITAPPRRVMAPRAWPLTSHTTQQSPLPPAHSKWARYLQQDSCPVLGSLQHPSRFQENGVYVELARRVIPAEWMGEGRQGDGQSEEPYSRPEVALPRASEQEK